MDTSYIPPIMNAVNNVFDTMLRLQVDVGEAHAGRGNESKHDVSAIISFTGEYQGSLVLTFPTEVAERVVALFIGAEVTADDDDFADAVGELANMVSGNAKAGFEGKTVSISCPSVIIGTGHAVRQPSDMPIVIIPCDCECGSFAIEVSLRAAPALAAKSA